MMRDHKPISIADQVFEKLERDILSGKYRKRISYGHDNLNGYAVHTVSCYISRHNG